MTSEFNIYKLHLVLQHGMDKVPYKRLLIANKFFAKNIRIKYKHRTSELSIEDVHDKVTDLSIAGDFNESFDLTQSNIETLDLGHYFNRVITKDMFPGTLQSLKLGYRFNQPIAINTFPDTLRILRFGDTFIQNIPIGSLPPALHTLEFGTFFNRPINKDVLPSTLRVLQFGSCFNRAIDKDVLPPKLRTLIFGCEYIQSFIQDALPASLNRLEFKRNLLIDVDRHTVAVLAHHQLLRFTCLFGNFIHPDNILTVMTTLKIDPTKDMIFTKEGLSIIQATKNMHVSVYVDCLDRHIDNNDDEDEFDLFEEMYADY